MCLRTLSVVWLKRPFHCVIRVVIKKEAGILGEPPNAVKKRSVAERLRVI